MKNLFSKISQDSQENTRVGVSFLIKFQTYFIKKETSTHVFSCEVSNIFKKIFFSHNTSGGYFWMLIRFPLSITVSVSFWKSAFNMKRLRLVVIKPVLIEITDLFKVGSSTEFSTIMLVLINQNYFFKGCNIRDDTQWRPRTWPNFQDPLCIAASGNILVSGNLCFRVFKFQLKVINKNICYLYCISN